MPLQPDVISTPAEEIRKAHSRVQRKARKQIEKKATQLEQIKVIYVDRMTVTPNPYNPNRQTERDFELLCRSMEEDGFTQPIIVCNSVDYTPAGGGARVHLKNVIIDGEHRWRAAGAVFGEHTEIPIVLVEMSEEQMRISTFRHNRARGSEDINLAAEVMQELKKLGAIDWAKDSLMLDDAEMNRILDDAKATDMLAADEYSQAWEPTGKISTSIEVSTAHYSSSYTPASAEAIKKQGEIVKSAKTEEERTKAIHATTVYRVSFVFNGAEAEIAKQALTGDTTPAAVFLEMCVERDAELQAAKELNATAT